MAEIRINDIPPLTTEEIKRLKELDNRPIVYDDDCPESTPAMLKAFEVAAELRDRIVVAK